MANTYSEGQLVKLKGTFTDEAGALVDPTVVNVTVKDPEDNIKTYVYNTDAEVIRVSVGIYTILVDTTGFAGLWLYRWFSTGSGQSADTNQYFRVLPARPA